MRTFKSSNTDTSSNSQIRERGVTASQFAAGLLPSWVNEPAGDVEKEAPASRRKVEAFLTVEDVAAYLRVSTKTVRRQIAAGHISAIRIGRLIRVSPEEIMCLVYGKYSRVISNKEQYRE